MTRRVRPRRGVSLTEVLVAMFMMAVGMLAIFTLFPLGAMQVGQALRDDRTSQTAQQADGYVRDLWRNHVVAELDAGRQPAEPFFWAMNDPNQFSDPPAAATNANMARTPKLLRSGNVYGNSFLLKPQQLPSSNDAPKTTGAISPTMLSQDPVATTPANTPASTTAGDPNINTTYYNATFTNAYPNRQPTYPVLIDPIGYVYRPAPDQYWVSRTAAASGVNRVLLPRRQLNAIPAGVAGIARALTIAALTDDVIFDPNGAPPSGSGAMTRQGRYSWAAIVQRPDANRPTAADLTVLTFDGRPRTPAINPTTAPTPAPNWAYNDEYVTAPAFFSDVNTREVTVDVPTRGSDDPVLVRRGGWVMDGTIDTISTPMPTGFTHRRHAHFYRITAVTEGASSGGFTRYVLDLETPLKAPLYTAPSVAAEPPASQLYFFSGLAEVFVRPSLGPDFNH